MSQNSRLHLRRLIVSGYIHYILLYSSKVWTVSGVMKNYIYAFKCGSIDELRTRRGSPKTSGGDLRKMKCNVNDKESKTEIFW